MALDRLPPVSIQSIPNVPQPFLERCKPLINSLGRRAVVIADRQSFLLALKVLACGVLLAAALVALRKYVFPEGKAAIVGEKPKDSPSLPALPSAAIPQPDVTSANQPSPAAIVAPTVVVAAAPILNAPLPSTSALMAAYQPQSATIPAAALLQSALPARGIDTGAIDHELRNLFLVQPPKTNPVLIGSYVGVEKGPEYSEHDQKILAFLEKQQPRLYITVEEVKVWIEIGNILINYAQDPSKTRETKYILDKLNENKTPQGNIIRATAQASIVWHYMDIAIEQGFDFKEGSFNIDDETGGLEQFMGGIEGTYFRICSHLNRFDDSKTKGFNVDNLREGSMPGHFRHILFKGFEWRGKRRLFIKPEHWGTQGNGIVNSVVHFAGHSYEYVSGLGARKITGTNARKDFHKERIPEEKRKKFIEAAKNLPGYTDALAQIGKDGAGTGVGGMYVFAKDSLNMLPAEHPSRRELGAFVEYLEEEYPVETLMQRIGDEPVIEREQRPVSPGSPIGQE